MFCLPICYKLRWSSERGMKPWKRFFFRPRCIALPGATVEKEMFAASSRDPLVPAPPKWSWEVFDWIDTLVSLNFRPYQTEIYTHILASDCNFYLAKVAIFRFLFKWMSYMISLGYQNHPSILGLHVWDAYLDFLLVSRCFLVVQNFASRPQKIGGSETNNKQNMQTRPNLSKMLGTLPARSWCIAVGWHSWAARPRMGMMKCCFPFVFRFIDLFVSRTFQSPSHHIM